MPTKEDLRYFQSMPLDIKVAMTRTRIREWVTHFGESGTYISFSGGKDSTVLLHLVRELYPDIPAVFVNTGLEYPEIQKFVKSFDNVTILTPDMSFPEVIKEYGYPFISKDISQAIHEARKGYKYRIDKLNGELLDRNGNKSPYNAKKYGVLLDVDFRISHKCCNEMKKKPAKRYERESDRLPLIATMACESKIRETLWTKQGCNSFESNRPQSKPMSFWTENDILKYIKENNIQICSVYGEIIPEDPQLSFEGCLECDKLCTTGAYRTGCIFCGFGAHLDKNPRFIRLKETHPKQYNYCMGGGEYDIDGIWRPNQKGLGMAHVIDKLNELYSKNGKLFIEY